jgi:hypothetical protein
MRRRSHDRVSIRGVIIPGPVLTAVRILLTSLTVVLVFVVCLLSVTPFRLLFCV